MRIVSSFLRLDELAPLAKAGADEVYCAVDTIPSFGYGGTLRDMPALKKAVRRAHSLGLKISLAANSVIFSFDPSGEARLVELFSEADAAGVDNFIVANPAVFALFSKLRLRAGIHLSSVQPCFNSLTAELFIRLGVSRIILPNQLSPFEARKILSLCRGKGVETEIFDYRFFGCAYVNGRCFMDLPDHSTFNPGYSGGTMCHPKLRAGGLPAPRVMNLDPEWKSRLGGIMQRFSDRFAHGTTPRIANPASFFDFFSGGVDYLKYGIRLDNSADKVKKVGELRAMLDLAEKLSAALPRTAARRKFVEKMSQRSPCTL